MPLKSPLVLQALSISYMPAQPCTAGQNQLLPLQRYRVFFGPGAHSLVFPYFKKNNLDTRAFALSSDPSEAQDGRNDSSDMSRWIAGSTFLDPSAILGQIVGNDDIVAPLADIARNSGQTRAYR